MMSTCEILGAKVLEIAGWIRLAVKQKQTVQIEFASAQMNTFEKNSMAS